MDGKFRGKRAYFILHPFVVGGYVVFGVRDEEDFRGE